MPSPKVFVSYSHRDSEALEQLRRFLHTLEREGLLAVWMDTGLQAGDDWKRKIDQALAEATVAVLLIEGQGSIWLCVRPWTWERWNPAAAFGGS